ncbi:MAG: hypothetical protein ACR2QL_09860 [Woeseiaceae bacterium]
MHIPCCNPTKPRIASCVAVTLLLGGVMLASNSNAAEDEPTHMPESQRTAVIEVVVVGGPSAIDQEITGTYEKTTPGLLGGISGGAAAGTPSAQMGPVNVNFPFPILQLPGAIIGGISGSAKRHLQELRDAMTDDIAEANSKTLINEGLALDVYRGLQRLPELGTKLYAASTELPDGTDAVMYVSVKEITIDVEKNDAILTAAASISLESVVAGSKLYSQEFRYQDRASLEEWTENDNALWLDFANYARHYLGREITADSFTRIELNHELQPIKTDDIKLSRKNVWKGSTRAAMPTLAWRFKLLENTAYGTWTDAIDAQDVYFDLEIYDQHRMVYEMKNLSETSHTLVYELDPCQTYRWSVRPSYYIGEDVRIGEWMQLAAAAPTEIGNGIAGRDAAASPAYTQDYASLEFDCRR